VSSRSTSSPCRRAFAGLMAVLAGCDDGGSSCVEGAAIWSDVGEALLCVSGDLVVTDRSAEALGALRRVTHIEGSLLVYDNPDLLELPELPALRRLGGSLSITDNQALEVVAGFPLLERVPGQIYVVENPALRRVVFGDALRAAGSLFIALNDRLAEVSGVAALSRVEGDARFTRNERLARVELPGVVAIDGALMVRENASLGTVEMPSLERVTILEVQSNPALDSLAGFPALETVEYAVVVDNRDLRTVSWRAAGTRLEILSNPELTRVTAADSARIASLRVEGNHKLHTIEGFAETEALTWLYIANSAALEEIPRWGSLTRVDDLTITYTSLDGPLVGAGGHFPALSKISGDLGIYDNPFLPPADVDALLQQVEISGETRVGDNKDQETALDPCPWRCDDVCDGAYGNDGGGTGLCAEDPEDCHGVGACDA
jgi:hypothetical protein